jgi:glycosyltransferase involved in cell wall biosynthesis
VYYPVDKQLIRHFPFVIAVSDQIKNDLIRAGVPEERVTVVLNGIDPAVFQRGHGREAEYRRGLGIAPGEFVVASAGRLEPQKRFDLLMEACARVRQRHPQLRLLIAGDGSLRSELQEIAGRLLPGACTLLGHCGDIRPLHHAANMFVQSSDYEGTPNTVLEAMALETPLVATAAGGTAQVAVHGIHALIVPPGDAVALSAAIERAMSDEAGTRSRVARARRRVEGALSFANRMMAVENLYEAAIAAASPRQALSIAGRWA